MVRSPVVGSALSRSAEVARESAPKWKEPLWWVVQDAEHRNAAGGAQLDRIDTFCDRVLDRSGSRKVVRPSDPEQQVDERLAALVTDRNTRNPHTRNLYV